MASYLSLWEYRVTPDAVKSFREAYGPDGAWAQLFRRAPGYVRTELHRDHLEPDRFLTIDHWKSEAAWQLFRTRYAAEYETLDALCAALTLSEAEIGGFERVE